MRPPPDPGIEELPPVRYVTVADTEVSVAVDHDCPAPPGFTNATPDRWVTTESFDTLADLAGGTVDPLPLLCPIGATTAGHQVLVHLERHGAIAVAGDPDATIGLLRSPALAMATVSWAAAPPAHHCRPHWRHLRPAMGDHGRHAHRRPRCPRRPRCALVESTGVVYGVSR